MAMNMPSPAATPNTPVGRSAVRRADSYIVSPSWFSAGAGVWLILSVFVWDHRAATSANNMIVGAMITAVALGALRMPRLRYLNVVLAAWLLASALVLEHAYSFTIWHNIVLALVVLGASLSPAARTQAARWSVNKRAGAGP